MKINDGGIVSSAESAAVAQARGLVHPSKISAASEGPVLPAESRILLKAPCCCDVPVGGCSRFPLSLQA